MLLDESNDFLLATIIVAYYSSLRLGPKAHQPRAEVRPVIFGARIKGFRNKHVLVPISSQIILKFSLQIDITLSKNREVHRRRPTIENGDIQQGNYFTNIGQDPLDWHEPPSL